LLRARNRHDESESLHRRALAIREKSYGPDHPDVAESLNNLALVFQATNRFAEAEALFSRAFAICQERFGADHPRTVTARKNLAALLAALSKGGSATSSRLPAKPRGKRLRR
jgi:tetratricopeptide (TPR) repeat protein